MTINTKKYVHSSMLLPIIAITCAIVVTGCGGGSGNDVSPPVVIAPPVVTPTPTPEEPEVCTNQVHLISTSSDDGSFEDDYGPQNVIDGDTNPESRWSSTGVGKTLTLDLGEVQVLQSLTIKWFEGAERIANFSIETSMDNATWTMVLEQGESSGRHSGFELVPVEESQARYVRITGNGNDQNTDNGIVEVNAHSCAEATGKFANVFPNELGIELIDWYLSVPTDEDNSGTSDSIWETDLAAGYTNSEFFYASADNGIVMRSPSYGFKTSENTNYVRVELREMLRRGDRSISTKGVNGNNWVFGSASQASRDSAGGVDGDLNVTLAVNQVTTTGEDYQIGRLIIGQIHANDDEPVRLYYRKLPGNSLGSIYFAHESRVAGSDEVYVELIGERSNSADNPEDGIALDEKFSYHINVNVDLLTVTISREGKADVVGHFDMSESLFDEDGQYHYFKVGVYHVNNSSDPEEYAQATFYEIRNSHTGYSGSE